MNNFNKSQPLFSDTYDSARKVQGHRLLRVQRVTVHKICSLQVLCPFMVEEGLVCRTCRIFKKILK